MVDERSLPVLAALSALLLVAVAEALHARRVARVAALAFGPTGRPALWVAAVPWLRATMAGAVAWGLVTLLLIPPRVHSAASDVVRRAADPKHVVIVLDVSPSMRLVDGGPTGEQSRMERARALLESFFRRVPLDEFRLSVVATYNGAKAVVVDTGDVEVVRNILGDLPMHYAFRSGKTKLFDGIEEAARIARPWDPRSTSVIIVSDGDTVPAMGMPRLPASVANTLVVGVGDPHRGTFIDGRQSRQDVATLRQIAARLGGAFHNGNEKHLATSLIGDLTAREGDGALERLGRREYALLAVGVGAAWLALLPLLLHVFGTAWNPGVRPAGAGLWSTAPRPVPGRGRGDGAAATSRSRSTARMSITERVPTPGPVSPGGAA